jgi:copper transport protein
MLGVAAVAAAALIAGAQPAWAHANLLSTDPEYGANLSVAPARVLVRYDLPVEISGAQVKLERGGQLVRLGHPEYGSADDKDVAVPLPKLGAGKYLLTWFLFGSDGDVMGGELPFTVLGGGVTASAALSAPPVGGRIPTKRSFAPLSQAQDAARLVAVASLCLLIGGVCFVVLLWRTGLGLRRTRILLWSALGGAMVGNAASLGLKGAAVSGQSALHLFSPTALTALNGTHVGRVLGARLGFLLLALPFLAYLLIVPRRALRSDHWMLGSGSCAAGTLATHAMLSHAARRGVVGLAADAVHLGAVAVWLGGLVVLAVIVLPRRRSSELAVVVPRWSCVAFSAVSMAVLAGAVLLLVISPRWTALLRAPYGRFLLLKLVLVALLLTAAARAREFVITRLCTLTADGGSDKASGGGARSSPAPEHSVAVAAPPQPLLDRAALQPFVTAVTAELCIAASILTATAVLVGRPPPT